MPLQAGAYDVGRVLGGEEQHRAAHGDREAAEAGHAGGDADGHAQAEERPRSASAGPRSARRTRRRGGRRGGSFAPPLGGPLRGRRLDRLAADLEVQLVVELRELLLRARVVQLAGGVEEDPRVAERVLAQCVYQAGGHQRRITGGAQAVRQALGELGRRVRL